MAIAATAIGLTWIVLLQDESGDSVSTSADSRAAPTRAARPRADPAPPAPTTEPGALRGADTGIAKLLGVCPDPTPPNYRGSASAWRMHQGITRDECAQVLESYKSLPPEDRKLITMDVIRHPAPELRKPLLDAVAASNPVPAEAVLLANALVKLIEKAPLDPASAADGAAVAPTDERLASAVVSVTSRMLPEFVDVVSDATWSPITENLRRLRRRGLVGAETPGIADLRRCARTALSGLTEPEGTFAAGPAVFEFAREWPDAETVDLLIAATAVFQAHRSRLPRGADVDRACLWYACIAVTRSGSLDQVVRYTAVLDALDWAALDAETRLTLREQIPILQKRKDIDVPTRDALSRILERNGP